MGMTRSQEPTDLDRALAAVADEQASTPSAPGDDELVALACGELDEARAEAIRERLAVDPEAARRVLDIQSSLALEAPEGQPPLSAAEVAASWSRLEPKLVATAPRSSRRRGARVGRRSPWGRLTNWSLAATLVLAAVGAGWMIRSAQRTPGGPEVTLRATGRVDRGEEAHQALEVLAVGDEPTRLRLLLAGVELGGATAFEVCPSPQRSQPHCWTLTTFEPDIAPLLRFEVDNQSLPPGVYELELYPRPRVAARPLAIFEVRVVPVR